MLEGSPCAMQFLTIFAMYWLTQGGLSYSL